MTDTVLLVFLGRFRCDSFRDFVRHRAERLALRADIRTAHEERVEIAVAGALELIEAFELACSLGPIDCLVLEHHRRGIHQRHIGKELQSPFEPLDII
jgi:acylphosphatase